MVPRPFLAALLLAHGKPTTCSNCNDVCATSGESLLQNMVSRRLVDSGNLLDDTSSVSRVNGGAREHAQRILQHVAAGSYAVEPWLERCSGCWSSRNTTSDARLMQYSTDTATAADGTTSAPANGTAKSASDLVGIKMNNPEDMPIFLTALATNAGIVFIVFCVFGVLHHRFNLLYHANCASVLGQEKGPRPPSQNFIGWLVAAATLSTSEIQKWTTLDHAMCVEFTILAMRILSVVGFPMLCVLGPLHLKLGGAAEDDELSKIGMANVEKNSRLYWLHAASVWYVVLATEGCVFLALRRFMPMRHKWLKELNPERSCTVLVEEVPPELQTEEELAAYFNNKVLKQPAVLTVIFVKDTTDSVARRSMLDVMRKSSPYEAPDKMDALVNTARLELLGTRDQIRKDSTKNADVAFVVFKERHDAETVRRIYSPDNASEFVAYASPDPADIIWEDLCVNGHAQSFRQVLGYALVAVFFATFMPLVVGISAVTKLEVVREYVPFVDGVVKTHPQIARAWDGLAGSFALSTLMGLMPTILMLIFSSCWLHRAYTVLQHRLQLWSFIFLVIFVLLVTAVGSSLIQTAQDLIEHPTSVFALLANTLPSSSHFYLNWVPMQWVTLVVQLTRTVVLAKYMFFKYALGYTSTEAAASAGTEDQATYGLGFRSAMLTLTLLTCLVFCTISPLITALGFVYFALARLIFGYLFLYADTTEVGDLGGLIFVSQIDHLQKGLVIYIVLMTGVLSQRGSTRHPSYIAAASIIPLLLLYFRFQRTFKVERLPYDEIYTVTGSPKIDAVRRDFLQPQLRDDFGNVGSNETRK